ncbi:MAG: hypothetical protein OHK0046_41520 [Anaerolineae bacterium]
MFKQLRSAIYAEIYKLKHGSIPVTVVLLPVVIVVVMTFVLPLLQGSRGADLPGVNPWLSMLVNLLQIWAFIQAFIVAVITAQIAGLEHGNQRWKYLFALPLSRHAIYTAKVIVAIALFGISVLVMLGTLILSGMALTLLQPEIGIQASLPLADMILVIVVNYLASWLMITLHSWVALYWPSFGPSVGLAMVAFLLNLVLANTVNFSRVFPWALPTNYFLVGPELSSSVIAPEIALTSVLLSIIATVIIVPASAWLVTRRDVL